MDQSLSQTAAEESFLVIEPRRAISWLTTFVRAHAAAVSAGVLLAIMAAQMFVVVWRKSITIDEIVMIPSAYYHLAARNPQLVNEHPPLAKIFAGAPLLFVQPEEIKPDQITEVEGSAGAKWQYQERFWENNVDRFQTLSFWPRLGMIVLTIGLGIVIFLFARDLFGDRVAVIATALFALEPTVLAHGRVVQTDIPAAFGYLLFFFALYHYNHEATARRAAWLGLATAIAILAKFSMLLVGPVLFVFFIWRWWIANKQGRRALWRHAMVLIVAMLIVINTAYLFQRPGLSAADIDWIREPKANYPNVILAIVKFFDIFLPKDFVLGILFQLRHNTYGHAAGFLGMYGQTGWWYYFPVAFALKTTLPFLILSLASLGWAIYELAKKRDRRLVWLLIPFAIYTVFVLFSNIDIGVRYYLPAYPFLFILGAALLDRLFRSKSARRAGAVIALVLVAWIGIEAVRAFPNHLSYMNQLASRAPHWWYLSDSNVEWGDDLRALADYLHAHGETRVTDATLGGWFILHFYGIDRVEALLPPPKDPPRYIAIGGSYLNGSVIPSGLGDWHPATDEERVNFFAAYRNRIPEAIIGGSIYVYRQDGH
jgi:hypothetical protein